MRTDTEVEVRSSFAVLHSETSEQVAVDMEYHRTMYELHHRVNPKEVIVGWWVLFHRHDVGCITSHGQVFDRIKPQYLLRAHPKFLLARDSPTPGCACCHKYWCGRRRTGRRQSICQVFVSYSPLMIKHMIFPCQFSRRCVPET